MKKDRFYLTFAILFSGLFQLFPTYKNYFIAFIFLALSILSFFKDIYKEKISVIYWVNKKHENNKR